ncbi:MAG: dTDP-4-dehydrorhamnose reductase [Pseudomonadota bacterium]
MLIGDQGQVAWELKRTLSTLGDLIVVGRSTSPHALDLARVETVAPLVLTLRPDWIVNAAAYTAVDKAEQEEELATRINAEAVGELARAAQEVGALLLHYSTDYVFDGSSLEPYREDSPTCPQSAYGRSKLLGEEAIAKSGSDYLILRTSWVYGARGHNFLRTMRRLAREREELRVVADQFGCPTWSRHIAESTAQVLAQLRLERARWKECSGIYHVVSSGQASWHEFASQIIGAQRMHEAIMCQRVLPITTQEYPLPAARPAYSVMNTEKLRAVFGVHVPHWRQGLELVQLELDQEKI